MIINCGPAIYESANSKSVNYKPNNVRVGTRSIHKLLSVSQSVCELRPYQCAHCFKLEMRQSKGNKSNIIYFNIFINNSWFDSRYTPKRNYEIYRNKWKRTGGILKYPK